MSEQKDVVSEPAQVEMVEEKTTGDSSPSGDNAISEQGDREERVTAKAWLCIFFLTLSFGAPFWATPTTAAISSQLLGQFGQSELSAWVVPCITTVATVTILLFAANSDLFGRRWFLIAACAIGAVGYIICALATSNIMLIAGLSLNGCASGISGIALIAVPELIPNKYRHIGIVIADGLVYIFIVIGPVVGRYSIIGDGEKWRYLYWAGFALEAFTGIGLFVFYFPPKHPRGIPFKTALKGLDWVGGFLFTIGAVLVLVAIVYTSYLPATDPKVLVCLCVGLAVIVVFALWERFAKVEFPLCPNEIFVSHNGREFAVPFCLTFIVVGFFYGASIIYPNMLNYFYIDENTSTSEQLLLTLPTNLGLVLGSVALTVFGGKIRHWNWSMTVSMASLCLWGSLLALITPNNKALMITFATLCQFSYGWAAYLSVTYTQLGVPQHMLGLSGGLAGTARYAGGAVASACYSTAISNGMAKKLVELVPKAAIRTGVPADIMDSVIAAASSGATTTALKEIPGLTDTMVDALRMAFKESAAVGLRNASLASMAFGIVGVILCLFLEDIEPKMTPKIETFLENDALADKNKYH